MDAVRLALLNAIQPATKAVGELHAPYSHREVTGYHYFVALPWLKPGSVLLSKKNGEASNLLIPGDFTHAAMYCGMDRVRVNGVDFEIPFVVEAIGEGVVKTDLITFMLTKDRVAICRPIFTGETVMAEAAKWALRQAVVEKAKYDFQFDPRNKAFYCSELCWKAYEQILGQKLRFSKRTTLGVLTVAPQDYYDARSYWAVDFDTLKLPFKSSMRMSA